MASPDVSGFKFGVFFLQLSIVDIPAQILLTLFDLPCLILILQELTIYRRRCLFGMSTDVNSQFTLKQKSANSEEQYGEQNLSRSVYNAYSS